MNTLLIIEQRRQGSFRIRAGRNGCFTVFSDKPKMTALGSSSKPEEDFNFVLDCFQGEKFIGHIEFSFSMFIDSMFVAKELNVIGAPSNESIFIHACLMVPSDLSEQLNTPDTVAYPSLFAIGHRGSGSNRVAKNFLENTLEGFNDARDNGAEFVEFDIQLTKDNVPVIYHDFFMTKKQPEKFESTKANENTYVIQQFTEEEFRRTGFETDYNTERPSFRDLLVNLPENLGFDIELKYPAFKNSERKCMYAEMNHFVDRTLEEMVLYGGNRKMFFSSFDPFVVTMLRIKQKKWPVWQLLHKKGHETDADFVNKVRTCAPLHQYLGVQGFVLESAALLKSDFLISEIKNHGFLISTYGNPNNDADEIERQLKLGVRGICTDKVSLVRGVLDEYKKHC